MDIENVSYGYNPKSSSHRHKIYMLGFVLIQYSFLVNDIKGPTCLRLLVSIQWVKCSFINKNQFGTFWYYHYFINYRAFGQNTVVAVHK